MVLKHLELIQSKEGTVRLSTKKVRVELKPPDAEARQFVKILEEEIESNKLTDLNGQRPFNSLNGARSPPVVSTIRGQNLVQSTPTKRKSEWAVENDTTRNPVRLRSDSMFDVAINGWAYG
jgi:hypothetical protein